MVLEPPSSLSGPELAVLTPVKHKCKTNSPAFTHKAIRRLIISSFLPFFFNSQEGRRPNPGKRREDIQPLATTTTLEMIRKGGWEIKTLRYMNCEIKSKYSNKESYNNISKDVYQGLKLNTDFFSPRTAQIQICSKEC